MKNKTEVELLIEYRTKWGLTQEKIARGLNVSVMTVHRWLHGHSNPHPFLKEKIVSYVKTKP